MDETDSERGHESRRANKRQMSERQKQEQVDNKREAMSQKYYRKIGNPFAITELNRPYFIPLPEGWEKHKHLNVPGKNGKWPIEEGLKTLVQELDAEGVFDVAPPEPKKPKAWVSHEVSKIPKKKDVEAVDKEIAADLLDDTVDES